MKAFFGSEKPVKKLPTDPSVEVHGGLLSWATTHAPHGPQVEQSPEQCSGVVPSRRHLVFRMPQRRSSATSEQKTCLKSPQSGGPDGLVRQNFIYDNQGHHAREN